MSAVPTMGLHRGRMAVGGTQRIEKCNSYNCAYISVRPAHKPADAVRADRRRSDIQGSVDVMDHAYEDVPFSELLHRPAATTQRLDHVRALRLRRRDAGDLALMPIERLERDSSVVDFTARLIAGLVNTGNADALRQALPHALPWTTFLPTEDVDELLTELVTTTGGAAALGNLTPIARLLTQWRHSAEIYADPELLAKLTREPEGDLGPVPMPEPAE